MTAQSNDKHLESWHQALRILQSMDAHERKNHFDMREWGYQNHCGTVACIAGHCCLDPWFAAERGLAAKWEGSRLSVPYTDFSAVFGQGWEDIFMCHSGWYHVDAVRAVMVKISELSGESVCPFGFGMPAHIPALEQTP